MPYPPGGGARASALSAGTPGGCRRFSSLLGSDLRSVFISVHLLLFPSAPPCGPQAVQKLAVNLHMGQLFLLHPVTDSLSLVWPDDIFSMHLRGVYVCVRTRARAHVHAYAHVNTHTRDVEAREGHQVS